VKQYYIIWQLTIQPAQEEEYAQLTIHPAQEEYARLTRWWKYAHVVHFKICLLLLNAMRVERNSL
jgi:hypothetical protein